MRPPTSEPPRSRSDSLGAAWGTSPALGGWLFWGGVQFDKEAAHGVSVSERCTSVSSPATRARHSRVQSSTTARARNRRPYKRAPQSAEETVRDIRRATRRHFSAEEKIRIVLEGLRGEDSKQRAGLSLNSAAQLSRKPDDGHFAVSACSGWTNRSCMSDR